MPELGKLVDFSKEEDRCRDAVHLAIAPVMAGVKVFPGEDVCFQKDKDGNLDTTTVVSCERSDQNSNAVGIVDPFLKDAVWPGQRFWLFLYPGTITSLKHNWTHPAFKKEKEDATATPESTNLDLQEAMIWMQDFAQRVGLSYSEVIQAGREFVADGEYFTQYGTETARSAMYEPETKAVYWKNFEIITGIKPDAAARDGEVFSCSC